MSKLEADLFEYSIEMFKDNKWQKEIRWYNNEKSLYDFDLCDVEGKRKSAKLIGVKIDDSHIHFGLPKITKQSTL